MQRKHESGFSLLELVVSAAVMSVMILAIYGYFNHIRSANRHANNIVISNQIAHQQIETYRNTSYNDLVVGTHDVSSILTPYPSLHAPRTATAVITETEPNGLKQISLTITYTDNGGVKTVYMNTLVASRGVNQ